MSERILTDEEIRSLGSLYGGDEYTFDSEDIDRFARAIESAILAKLPSLGYVKLKPGQVVAEWKMVHRGFIQVEHTKMELV